MNTIKKIAVALGLAGAATAYAMNGEARVVQPLAGQAFGETRTSYNLPLGASGFTLVDLANDSSYSGFTDLTRPIVGPLSGRARLSHNQKPISSLEAGLVATIPTGKLPAYAETYLTHNGKTGTLGVFGTIKQKLATMFGKDLNGGVDVCAETYGQFKPESYWANASPWMTFGPLKVGYNLTATPEGLSNGVYGGITF